MTRNQFAGNCTRVRIPPAAPRRCGRHIVRSDFLQKSLLTHSVAAPFSFKTHGFEADFCILASVTSLATTLFLSEQSSSRAHSAAPPFSFKTMGFETVFLFVALALLPFLSKPKPKASALLIGRRGCFALTPLLLSASKPWVLKLLCVCCCFCAAIMGFVFLRDGRRIIHF